MELTDDQCAIVVLRGQITDLEVERDKLQQELETLRRFLQGGAGGQGLLTVRCGSCNGIIAHAGGYYCLCGRTIASASGGVGGSG